MNEKKKKQKKRRKGKIYFKMGKKLDEKHERKNKKKKEKSHFMEWMEKKLGPFLDLCVSSLRRGHANLLCIVPILSDVSEETPKDVHFQFI